MIYKFDDIAGNTSSLQLIKRSLDMDSFPQISIMGGVMGTGKSSTAKAVALALTCDTIREHTYNPCCSCVACKNAIASFKSTGKSSYVKIFNAGQLTKIEDVKGMIDQIFVRDSGLHKNVYIIEEAHALANVGNAQTILLDELDRMPPNAYLIMTTTNPGKILKTIRSRAITFKFHRLTMSESRVFIDKLCEERGYTFSASSGCSRREVTELIAKNAMGIPRDMERALDFIHSTKPSRAELLDFFQQISDDEFLDLIVSAIQPDALLYSQAVDGLCNTYEPDIVVPAFKDYVSQKYFEVMSDTVHSKVLTSDGWDELIRFASGLSGDCTDADLRIKFLNLRLRLRKKSPLDIIKDNAVVGKAEKKVGAEEYREEVITQSRMPTSGSDELTMSDLFSLQKGSARS